jgi:DNA-binding transcriptional LysR family regulator
MNLRQLEVFVAVVESANFTRGAEAAFLSQSSASGHIADLEAEFGARLLDRTGKKVLPTAAGRLLLQRARRILHGVRETELTMRRFVTVEEAPLTVSSSNVPGNYLIPAVLPAVYARFPGLSLTVLCDGSKEALDHLAREEVEIAVVGSRVTDERFSCTTLTEDRVVLIMAQGHRLAQCPTVSLAELIAEPFILRTAGSGTGRALEQALLTAGVGVKQLRVRARLGSNEAVKRAVAEGVGVSFVSEFSVAKEFACGALVPVAVPEVQVCRQFAIARLAGRELSPAATAFSSMLLERFAAPRATDFR